MSKVHKVGCKLRANDCEGLMFDTRMRSVLQFLALLWFMAWLLHAWRVPYGIGSRAALLIFTSCSPLLHQDQQRYNLDDAEFREECKYGLIWPCLLGIQYSQPFVCGDLWHAELESVTLWTAHLMKTWDVQLEWEWHSLHFQERRWMERQNQRVRKKCPHKSLNNSWTMMMSLSFVLQLFGCFQHVSPPSIQVRWSRTTANNATGRDGRDLRAFVVVHRWLCPHIFVLVSLHGNIELTRTAKLKTLRNTVRSIHFLRFSPFLRLSYIASQVSDVIIPLWPPLVRLKSLIREYGQSGRNGRTRSVRRRWQSWIGWLHQQRRMPH